MNIIYDDKSRKHKGFGSILFKEKNVTEKALGDSLKYSLRGRKIKFLVGVSREVK